jgi:hypothetical protein
MPFDLGGHAVNRTRPTSLVAVDASDDDEPSADVWTVVGHRLEVESVREGLSSVHDVTVTVHWSDDGGRDGLRPRSPAAPCACDR